MLEVLIEVLENVRALTEALKNVRGSHRGTGEC
jgi:hypothetical protein